MSSSMRVKVVKWSILTKAQYWKKLNVSYRWSSGLTGKWFSLPVVGMGNLQKIECWCHASNGSSRHRQLQPVYDWHGNAQKTLPYRPVETLKAKVLVSCSFWYLVTQVTSLHDHECGHCPSSCSSHTCWSSWEQTYGWTPLPSVSSTGWNATSRFPRLEGHDQWSEKLYIL